MTFNHNGGPKLTAPRGGWIAVSRDLRDHWLVGFGQPVEPADPDRPRVLSRSEAWLDLLMECRYETGSVMNGGRKMEIRPGELVGAVSWLAWRWNWTPKTVRSFLDKLEADDMIRRFRREPNGDEVALSKGNQAGNQAAVVSVSNFSQYQIVEEVKGQSDGQSKGNRAAIEGQSKGNKNKDNKGTREQEDIFAAAAADGDLPEDRAAMNRRAAREAFALWQKTAQKSGLPVPRETSFDVFGKKIATRMYEHAKPPKGFDEMLAVWKQALANVERSSYLRGMTPAGFRADLKFLVQPESFAKCLDGGYGNGAHAAARPAASDNLRRLDLIAGDDEPALRPREDQ